MMPPYKWQCTETWVYVAVSWQWPLGKYTRILSCCIVLSGCIVFSAAGVCNHGDVIKWNYFQRYWPFVRGIHRSPVNSPHKDQWRRALMFSLIFAWINGWVYNGEAGDLRCHRAHYDVIVMTVPFLTCPFLEFYTNTFICLLAFAECFCPQTFILNDTLD